jgi:hypothetical protein
MGAVAFMVFWEALVVAVVVMIPWHADGAHKRAAAVLILCYEAFAIAHAAGLV